MDLGEADEVKEMEEVYVFQKKATRAQSLYPSSICNDWQQKRQQAFFQCLSSGFSS